MQTYVYEQIEVEKTGRTASKQLTNPMGRQSVKTVTLVEITPHDKTTYGDWKKWVTESDLCIIEYSAE